MKNLVVILGILIIMPAAAMGELSTRVCQADGNTPFIDHPIMVGTKLTIIVNSDIGDPCACDLAIWDDDCNRGKVEGRDWNEPNLDYQGSHFPAAGEEAIVYDWLEDDPNIIRGISMLTGTYPEANDWFIVDYNAIAVGDCNVGFFENFSYEPSHEITFHHVPTRDFNQDTIVSFADFAVLASYWQQSCIDDCEGADLEPSGFIDPNDLMLFCDYWLEETD